MRSRENCPAIEREPGKLGGAWVFRCKRVPVMALFENLKDGASVEQFLEWFPGVENWKAQAVLDHATNSAHFHRVTLPS